MYTHNLEDFDPEIKKYIDLERYQSSTVGYKITFIKNGAGIDITNYKIYFTLKLKKEDTDENAKINKTVTIHTDAANGKTLIEFLAEDTEDLVGSYYYSIDFINTADDSEDVLFIFAAESASSL